MLVRAYLSFPYTPLPLCIRSYVAFIWHSCVAPTRCIHVLHSFIVCASHLSMLHSIIIHALHSSIINISDRLHSCILSLIHISSTQPGASLTIPSSWHVSRQAHSSMFRRSPFILFIDQLCFGPEEVLNHNQNCTLVGLIFIEELGTKQTLVRPGTWARDSGVVGAAESGFVQEKHPLVPR